MERVSRRGGKDIPTEGCNGPFKFGWRWEEEWANKGGVKAALSNVLVEDRDRPVSWGEFFLNVFLVGLLVSAAGVFVFQRLSYDWSWEGVWKYRQLFFNGWWETLKIAAFSLAGSLAVGVGAGLAGRSPFLPLRYLARSYVELVRCTPLLVQIYILFYGVEQSLALGLDRVTMGIIILSIFNGAYIGEIIRAGIESVPGSLWESARAIGLEKGQTYRLVIFPLATRQCLPPLAGQLVSLIKDSSLLSVIGIGELALNAQQVASFTLNPFETYLVLALGYLALTLPVSFWIRRLETRFRYES